MASVSGELDLERARLQLDGDADLALQLLAVFLGNAPAALQDFRAAIAAGDRAAVLRYLHRTVPTLALLARAELAAEARRLYEAVEAASGPMDAWLPGLRALADRLAALLDEARSQIPR